MSKKAAAKKTAISVIAIVLAALFVITGLIAVLPTVF